MGRGSGKGWHRALVSSVPKFKLVPPPGGGGFHSFRAKTIAALSPTLVWLSAGRLGKKCPSRARQRELDN